MMKTYIINLRWFELTSFLLSMSSVMVVVGVVDEIYDLVVRSFSGVSLD